MTPLEQLADPFLESGPPKAIMSTKDNYRCNEIIASVRGWSDAKHYAFFMALLRVPIKSLLMLGIYQGRDIAFLVDILKAHYPDRKLRITGVDRFEAAPCADWPEQSRNQTWEEFIQFPPPDFDKAKANTLSPLVEIIKDDDEQFLQETSEVYDCIYFDTAHDKKTVLRQLEQAKSISHPDTILCGDDYQERPNWGVIEAVKESFSNWHVFANHIWVSDKNNLI